MAVTKPEVHRLISKVNFSDSNRKPEQIKYLVKALCRCNNVSRGKL